MGRRRYGYVQFDSDVAKSGYYATGDFSDVDPVYSGKRFTLLKEIPSDVVAVTNFSDEQMMLNNLAQNSAFRNERFMRTPPDALIRQTVWHQTHASEDATYVGNLFDRIIRIYCAMADIDPNELKLSPWSMKSQIRQTFFPVDPSLGNWQRFYDALIDSTGYFTRIITGTRPSAKFYYVEMKYRLFDFIKALGDIVVPVDAKVKHLDSSKTPVFKSMEHLSEYMRDPSHLGVWAVNIVDVDVDFMSTFNVFGSAATREIASKRKKTFKGQYLTSKQWLTSHEVALLAEHGEVDLVEGFVFENPGERVRSHPVLGPFYRFLRKVISSAALSSHSVQLFTENALYAFSTSNSQAKGKNLSQNIFAPFLWSGKKIFLWKKVENLIEDGFNVVGYGGHGIRFAFRDLKTDTRFVIDDLVSLQNEHDLMPYAWDLGDLYPEDIEVLMENVVNGNRSDERIDIFAFWKYMILSTSIEERLEFDQKIVRKLIEKIHLMNKERKELKDTLSFEIGGL